jgi:hypothetical protein
MAEDLHPQRDSEIHQHINNLVTEEHRLERAHVGTALSPDEHDRLTRVGVELDQCWDLLRQRQARRSVGQDADAAAVRDATVVENYWQ